MRTLGPRSRRRFRDRPLFLFHWGINVMTGYSPREARMFGGQHIEHDRRYEMAGEFADMLCRLWGVSNDLTLQGRFWSVEQTFVTPKPLYGRASGAGECDGLAGRHRLRCRAFGPGLHYEPGRPRDRLGAGRAAGTQRGHQSRARPAASHDHQSDDRLPRDPSRRGTACRTRPRPVR